MVYKFNKKYIILGLGGSVLYNDDNNLNIKFLKKFKSFLEERLNKNQEQKFFVVVGGGKLARKFQKISERLKNLTAKDKDWIGIYATRLNAMVIKNLFSEKIVCPYIFERRNEIKNIYSIKNKNIKIFVIAGWEPGYSTDFVAAATAFDLKIGEYILAGKPAFVYDKNPDKYKNAKAFKELSWKNYRKMISPSWKPGEHFPIDPVASKFSEDKKLKAIVVNGKDFKNLENLLSSKHFKGTIVL